MSTPSAVATVIALRRRVSLATNPRLFVTTPEIIGVTGDRDSTAWELAPVGDSTRTLRKRWPSPGEAGPMGHVM